MTSVYLLLTFYEGIAFLNEFVSILSGFRIENSKTIGFVDKETQSCQSFGLDVICVIILHDIMLYQSFCCPNISI